MPEISPMNLPPEKAVIDCAAELVRIPSILGNEQAVALAAANHMRALDYDHVEIDPAGNAVGVIQGHAPGPTLLFDGHLDTVDVTPRHAWTRDPFGAEIIAGRMYGRGTSDMKGAVAAMIHGAAAVQRRKLHGRIVVSASVGEETVEGRALAEVMNHYPPDFIIIGEATELNVVHAGRGRAEFILTAPGIPAHASTPHLGQNAILNMLPIIRELERLPAKTHPVTGQSVTAVTAIISDPYPAHSVIPNACRVTCERRLLPGETLDDILQEFTQACNRANVPAATVEPAHCVYTTYTGLEWRQPKWFPAWITDANSPLVKTAQAALANAGLPAQLAHYAFCTNAAHGAGVAAVPTIGYGPSTEALAHVIDEYIEIDGLTRAVRGYAAIAQALLSAPAT